MHNKQDTVFIHLMGSYLAGKKGMKGWHMLQNMMLSEINQSQKTT